MDSQWSAIIACAGRGTRLGTDQKILHPIGDKLVLDYIKPHLHRFKRIVFVTSGEEHTAKLAAHLSGFTSKACQNEIVFVTQQKLIGTAEAVNVGLDNIATKYTMVLWGDQLVHPNVVDEGMSISEDEMYAKYDVFCPVMEAKPPYVELRIGLHSRIDGVRYQREGDEVSAHGMTDAGVFFFRTNFLRFVFAQAMADTSLVGRRTGELNFPTVLTRCNHLRVLPISPEHSIGVNTLQDVERAVSIINKW